MSFDKQIPPRSMPALDTRALQAQKERFHRPQSDARSFVSMAAECALTSRPPGQLPPAPEQRPALLLQNYTLVEPQGRTLQSLSSSPNRTLLGSTMWLTDLL